jgi:hypothetical protein
VNTPITPTTSVAEDTVSCLLTALVVESDLTRERLLEGCKTYLRQHRSAFDESHTPGKKLLLDVACHQYTNYDALADLIRRLTPGQGRVGRRVRKTLRQRIAAQYAQLLNPVEQQGAAQ